MMKKYQLNLLLSVLAILSLLGITHSFSAYQSDKNRHPSKACSGVEIGKNGEGAVGTNPS